MNKNLTLNIKFADFVFTLETQEKETFYKINSIYKPFITLEESIYKIRLDFSKPPKVSNIGVETSFSDNVYRILTEEFTTSFDLKSKTGLINVHSLFKIEASFNALKNLFMFFIIKSGDTVFHSSAVIKSGKAYVFLGPSGAGKSTIANSSKRYIILSEEIVGIRKVDSEYFAYSIPFKEKSEFLYRSRKPFPIKGIFLPIKSEKNSIKRIEKASSLARILTIPSGFDFLASDKEFLDAFYSIVDKVKCYELNFLPDDSFWRCVDEYFEQVPTPLT